jgi:translation initiation factor 1
MGLFDGTPLERPVLCDRCGGDIKTCKCPPPDTPPSLQRLKVALEKRSKGKIVTLVSGFQCSDNQKRDLLLELKNQCGTGGTMDADAIELQGDHLKRVQSLLQQKQYLLLQPKNR